jgi:hypothetical protein
MLKRVGLFVGQEWSWPPAFVEEVNRRDEGVVAELALVGGPPVDEPVRYDVLIDRISHRVPMYRSYLKKAVLDGRVVVNNPFMWSADDRFLGAALVSRLGIAVPRTVLLPNKDYDPGLVPTQSLRNLEYPLDWEAIVESVGLPCILRDAHDVGGRLPHVCHSVDEVLQRYDASGRRTMVLQQHIDAERFIRCLCIGREDFLPMAYEPAVRRCTAGSDLLSSDLGTRLVHDSLAIVRAFGYDLDAIDWAIRDGVPYAIDFMNPVPDLDVPCLTTEYFDWAVDRLATLAIRLARAPRSALAELSWGAMFRDERGRAVRPDD